MECRKIGLFLLKKKTFGEFVDKLGQNWQNNILSIVENAKLVVLKKFDLLYNQGKFCN